MFSWGVKRGLWEQGVQDIPAQNSHMETRTKSLKQSP